MHDSESQIIYDVKKTEMTTSLCHDFQQDKKDFAHYPSKCTHRDGSVPTISNKENEKTNEWNCSLGNTSNPQSNQARDDQRTDCLREFGHRLNTVPCGEEILLQPDNLQRYRK